MAPRRTRSDARSTGTLAPPRPKSRRRSSACSDPGPLVESSVAQRSPRRHGRRSRSGDLFMRRIFTAALLGACASAAIAAPSPKEQLLVPPASAEHFVIVSEAGKHGDAWRWTLPDGGTAFRESILLRGLIFEQDEVVKYDDAGIPVSIAVRGVTPQGDSAESYSLDANGTAHWQTQVDSGSSANASHSLYLPAGGTLLASDIGVGALLKAGENGLDLLPGGHGRLAPARTLTIDGPEGPKVLRLYFLNGASLIPPSVWLDDKGRLMAANNGLVLLPAGYESNLAKL